MHRTAFRRRGFATIATFAALLTLVVPSYGQQRMALPARLAAPTEAPMLSRLPASQRLSFSLSLPMHNKPQLQSLIHQLNDSTSPQYRKYLSVEQFTNQFGPTAEEYNKVLAYAKQHGLTVTKTYPNRSLVNLSGSVASVNEIFRVTMGKYKNQADGRTFFAPDVEPTIDKELPVLSVHGLSDYDLPHPMLKRAPAAALLKSDTTGSGDGGQFLGSDIRAAYVPGVTLNGTGQSVGLVELGPYNMSDVKAYFSAVGQPLNVPIYNVLLGVDGECLGTPSTGGCDDGEEVIDIQQAISMAPNLSALIVYEAYGPNSDALSAFTQAANDNVAKQLSLSFGFGGTPATQPGYEQIFMELAAQGQNTFIASGDGGASVGGNGYPGNSPNVTDVGGTDLTTAGPGGAWVSETGWVGSGGGWDTDSPIPAYQVPVINQQNQGSPLYRNVPDVAMEANTDNFFCANGSCSGGIGGTSLAAPRWAGFLALANEQANGLAVGFMNPTVYAIGQSDAYNTVFHDITVGNNFNDSSPSLFTATTGYDLVAGWGSPNGANVITALAAYRANTPNFTIAATPSIIHLTPGSSGTTTIAVSPTHGFTGTVDLSVVLIGSPTGVSATLSTSSIATSGSATLNVSTTSATQGGTIVIAVKGASNGITQTAYITLALPDFELSASPSSIYVNQNNYVLDTLSVTPDNGFAGSVALSLTTGLPYGVYDQLSPSTTSTQSTLAVAAAGRAYTQPSRSIEVVGTSKSITHALPSLTLAVSAAVGRCGAGTPVDLSSAFNLPAIYTDGSTFTSGGLDGGGAAYSATILTQARVLDGTQFLFGAANTNNAVFGAGQTVALPAGKFNTLQLLGTGIDGNQTSQAITVTYTDGTTSTFSQSFSDWFSPNPNGNETEAVAMPYRIYGSGTKDNRPFNVYGYTLLLDPTRTLKSFTLPNNRALIILAATLVTEQLGTQANLTAAFNATGIYTDGTTFAGDGGIDTGGAAYSANLLGDANGTSTLVVHDHKFNVAAANQPNVVFGNGQKIPLPAGTFNELHLLGTGLQGNQTAQTVLVHYTDGSTSTFTQSFSDWFTPQGFPNESVAVQMPYRDFNDGSQDQQNFNLYEYTLQINPSKTVASVELPQNRFVVVLGITLVNGPAPNWVGPCGFPKVPTVK